MDIVLTHQLADVPVNVEAEELCDIANRIAESRDQDWTSGREVIVISDDDDNESVLSDGSSDTTVVFEHDTKIGGLGRDILDLERKNETLDSTIQRL